MEPKANNRENYFDLLWENYTELIGEGYSEKPLEWVKLFRAESSNGAYEKYKEINGLPVWEENHEGQPYNEAQRSEGRDITIYNYRFDQSYSITWEYMEDNKERLMGGKGVSLTGAREMGRGCRVKQELTAAEIINNGFTAVGYDGVPLFSASHPLATGHGTSSNLLGTDKDLTDANLKAAIELGRKQVDNTGIKIQTKPNQIFVASNMLFKAHTIIHSLQVAGGSLNDKNVIANVAPLEIVEMSYFDDGIWLLKDSDMRNLIFQWRSHPEFGYYNVEGTADYKVWGRARWGVGYIDWRGLVGAKYTA